MKKYLLPILSSFVILSSLCQAQDTSLWGMTAEGGTNLDGTIFRYNISSGTEIDKYNFQGNGDAGSPLGSLMKASNGLLYGLTRGGGVYNNGTIFSYDISAGKETVLHNFGSGTDGAQPFGSLMQANNGLLYGTTFWGGINQLGTIFSYNISTGKETDVHDFDITGGINPIGSLIQASNGVLYGNTNVGGYTNPDTTNDGYGTIFSFNISTGTETDIHNFGHATDGKYPWGSLLQMNNGLLYGLTDWGGKNGVGIIFSYNISTSEETDIYDFSGNNDGANPNGSFILANNDLLYGTTFSGGINQLGTIFSYDISKGKETDLHDFGIGSDGNEPIGSLIQTSDGRLYGMTSLGGTNNSGSIFTYNISTGIETDVHNFGSSTDGAQPWGNLIEDDDTITGINHLAYTGDHIQLYPNPSTTTIHLNLNFQQDQPVIISLYNTLGQRVWAEVLGKTKQITTAIPVTKLANGVYILKVNSGNESQQKEVVVEK